MPLKYIEINLTYGGNNSATGQEIKMGRFERYNTFRNENVISNVVGKPSHPVI